MGSDGLLFLSMDLFIFLLFFYITLAFFFYASDFFGDAFVSLMSGGRQYHREGAFKIIFLIMFLPLVP
jgi:hypothetical protein